LGSAAFAATEGAQNACINVVTHLAHNRAVT